MYDTDQKPLLDRFLQDAAGEIIDLGAGLGLHTGHMLQRGRSVLALDRVLTPSLREIASRFPGRCRLMEGDLTCPAMGEGCVDAVWASHCLEHTTDPIGVLRVWRRLLRPEGVLGVVVPPFKTQVVGRHVFTGWTVGQLMLTLFRAEYSIRDGAYARHLYNVCAIVRPDASPPALEPNDEILCRYNDRFPPRIAEEILSNRRLNTFGETISWFEGDIDRLNW